jgi:hypothetical protein
MKKMSFYKTDLGNCSVEDFLDSLTGIQAIDFALSKKLNRHRRKTWLRVLIVFYLFLTCNDIIAAIFR